MRAMILAAGRGERMRPLTDTLPKPLLAVGGKPLIVWHIERLVRAGITHILINHAWLGEKIESHLKNGRQFGARISYSAEPQALETAGGIAAALHFFADQPFLVVNGDIWCDWDPGQAAAAARRLGQEQKLAWLLLVDNPDHHAAGDFSLDEAGLVHAPPSMPDGSRETLTFSGIGVYRPDLFQSVPAGQPAPLAPLLRRAMLQRRVVGRHYRGAWVDVGTPERLRALDRSLSDDAHARG